MTSLEGMGPQEAPRTSADKAQATSEIAEHSKVNIERCATSDGKEVIPKDYQVIRSILIQLPSSTNSGRFFSKIGHPKLETFPS